MTELEKLSEIIVLELTQAEYDYIKLYMTELYKGLCKIPKKMRTANFYMLDNLVNNTFSQS